jgi:hypothetical protein
MKRLLPVATLGIACMAGALGFAPPASADLLFTLGESNCCGTGPFATVLLDDVAAGVVDVTVTLIDPPSSGFSNTGLTTFVFNNSVTLTSSDVTNLTTGFAWATDIKGDGAGDFEYGFDCTVDGCANGGSNPLQGPLTFTLTATGLSSATFTANAVSGGKGGNYFGVDICDLQTRTGCTTTGMTWTSILPPPTQCIPGTPDCGDVPPPTVPEPASLALLAAGIVAISVTRRRLRTRR